MDRFAALVPRRLEHLVAPREQFGGVVVIHLPELCTAYFSTMPCPNSTPIRNFPPDAPGLGIDLWSQKRRCHMRQPRPSRHSRTCAVHAVCMINSLHSELFHQYTYSLGGVRVSARTATRAQGGIGGIGLQEWGEHHALPPNVRRSSGNCYQQGEDDEERYHRGLQDIHTGVAECRAIPPVWRPQWMSGLIRDRSTAR